MDFHSHHQKSFNAVGEFLIVHRLTFSPVRICSSSKKRVTVRIQWQQCCIKPNIQHTNTCTYD